MAKATKQTPTKKRAAKRRSVKTSRRKRSSGSTDKSGIQGLIGPLEYEDDGLRVNIYGESGSGKTTLAASFPKPMLFICVEKGTLSIHNIKGIQVFPKKGRGGSRGVLESMEQFYELMDWLIIEEGVSKFKTIVLDTITELQNLILMEHLNLEKVPTQLDWGMASQQDWGQIANKTKEAMQRFLNGLEGVNRIILAQQRIFAPKDADEYESELDLAPRIASALTPASAGWLAPQCDYVMQTFQRRKTVTKVVKVGRKKVKKVVPVEGTDFCLRVGPDPLYASKFRRPKDSETPLPSFIVDPTYQKIEKLIKSA